MKILELETSALIPYARNPRKNDHAVASVAASIKEFGFKVPIVIDSDNVIVCGHTRHKAAQKLGLKTVPCLVADDLTEDQIKAFRLLDNKIGEKADWDRDLLQIEIDDLSISLDPFDVLFDVVIPEFAPEDRAVQEGEKQFLVVVECADEQEQESIFYQCKEKAWKCRIIA